MLENHTVEMARLIRSEPYSVDIRPKCECQHFKEVVLNNSNSLGFLSPHFRYIQKRIYYNVFFYRYNNFFVFIEFISA